MKTLVVYFSWRGITARIGQKLAEVLAAEFEEIKCPEYKNLFSVFWRSIFARNRELTLSPLKYDPGNYHLVVVGSPTWAGRPPAPVVQYLQRNRSRLPSLAFFSTSAAPAEQRVLRGLEEAAGKSPVAKEHFHRSIVRSPDFAIAVEQFARRIRSAMPGPD